MSSKPTAESVTVNLDLHGKTALVTGASSGVGQEAARVLALRGATVLFAVRNVAKAAAVIAALSLPDEARARCVIVECDLGKLSTVRATIETIAARHWPVHFVLLNAGVFGLPYRLTDDGFEYTFQSNYLGHFILLHELLRRRLLATDGHVLATLSENVRINPFLRRDGALPLALEPEANRKEFRSTASPHAKVLTLHALRYATRFAADADFAAARFDACDPGATLTDNINQLGAVAGALGRWFGPLLFKPVERGAAVLAWAVTSPSIDGGSGRYFTSSLSEVAIPKRWLDADRAVEIWRATEAKLGLDPWPAPSV